MNKQKQIQQDIDDLTEEHLQEIAYVLEDEDSIGADLMHYDRHPAGATFIQEHFSEAQLPRVILQSKDDKSSAIMKLSGHRYLVKHTEHKTYVHRIPEGYDPEESVSDNAEFDPKTILGNLPEVGVTEYQKPADYETFRVRHSVVVPKNDFSSDTKEWLEENEVGEDCLPFRVVWETYKHRRIVRHYEVEVPDGFKSNSGDEKLQWCHDKAFDLFGAHKTLSETEEARGVDQIQIEGVEEAAFVNENGSCHRIHAPE
ncbi:hypothetical protein GGP80_003189 [Salinibacter ruber]|uniref:Uncharacterized protein n=1 Tax=Salinibacter ruber TaxID=146919 RepID=A0A9X2Q554_9BACT|nr:hypothetical protein [Salinibacter ruber]MCS3662002.1 hypothetical protein [Salinibacter ruber]MCS3711797.1 hypothetical protein [Salinibacter ruber]MCS3937180.1 hypothetical protein [Salinibacter ruber]MCS4119662.1 hypothetical protein [Salinibacter ruber]